MTRKPSTTAIQSSVRQRGAAGLAVETSRTVAVVAWSVMGALLERVSAPIEFLSVFKAIRRAKKQNRFCQVGNCEDEFYFLGSGGRTSRLRASARLRCNRSPWSKSPNRHHPCRPFA